MDVNEVAVVILRMAMAIIVNDDSDARRWIRWNGKELVTVEASRA